MKNFYFNIQSKGGAGKSMLTYLLALKHENDPKVAFVDLDSSTKTSQAQLHFIGKLGRLIRTDIYDREKKLDRERFIEVIEALNNQDMTDFFIDFGAPESEQLPGLFTLDYTVEEFKLIEEELGARFIFNVVMAGGPPYQPCFTYLKSLTQVLNGSFIIDVYANQYTFNNYENLLSDLDGFAKATGGLIQKLVLFGDFHPDRRSGKLILNGIRDGIGMQGYSSLSTKLILKRELLKL